MPHVIKIAGLSAILATLVTMSDLSVPTAATVPELSVAGESTRFDPGADVIAGLRCDGPGWPYVGAVCTDGRTRAIRTVGLGRQADPSGERRIAEVASPAR